MIDLTELLLREREQVEWRENGTTGVIRDHAEADLTFFRRLSGSVG